MCTAHTQNRIYTQHKRKYSWIIYAISASPNGEVNANHLLLNTRKACYTPTKYIMQSHRFNFLLCVLILLQLERKKWQLRVIEIVEFMAGFFIQFSLNNNKTAKTVIFLALRHSYCVFYWGFYDWFLVKTGYSTLYSMLRSLSHSSNVIYEHLFKHDMRGRCEWKPVRSVHIRLRVFVVIEFQWEKCDFSVSHGSAYVPKWLARIFIRSAGANICSHFFGLILILCVWCRSTQGFFSPSLRTRLSFSNSIMFMCACHLYFLP